MAKYARARSKAGTATIGGAAAAMAFEPVRVASTAEHEEIAMLAYSYWEARGCPHGSPDEDWFRAEMELRQRADGAA